MQIIARGFKYIFQENNNDYTRLSKYNNKLYEYLSEIIIVIFRNNINLYNTKFKNTNALKNKQKPFKIY